jgi:hypothetical protein
MKRLVIILLAANLVSCNKDHICNCTVTTYGTTETTTSSTILQVDTTIITPLSSTDVTKAKFKKISKRKAKFNCFDRSEDFDETSYNNIPGFINVTTREKGTRDYNCKIE